MSPSCLWWDGSYSPVNQESGLGLFLRCKITSLTLTSFSMGKVARRSLPLCPWVLRKGGMLGSWRAGVGVQGATHFEPSLGVLEGPQPAQGLAERWPCWGGFGVSTTWLWQAGFRARTLCLVCARRLCHPAHWGTGRRASALGESLCHSATEGRVTCHFYMLGPKNCQTSC